MHVVVDTPRGSRVKYKYDAALGLFRVSRILPQGMVFPFNFGFIPGTRGEDGDELDMLLVMEEPLAVGIVVVAKVLGGIRGVQTQDGKSKRNDRFLGAPVTEVNPAEVRSLRDINRRVLTEVEHFFVSYNAQQGRRFKPVGSVSARAAMSLIDKARAPSASADRR